MTRGITFGLLAIWLLALPLRAGTTNVLTWTAGGQQISADLHGEALTPLLETIARKTGWQIFVEPGISHTSSTKFADLPMGEALKMLLGDLNYAVVPRTNGPQQLFVFSTSLQSATLQVKGGPKAMLAKHVANQLLVKVKPGTDIEHLARLVGAKVVGRDDKLGIYLLEFPDATATDNALAVLKADTDVLAVDYNYYYNPVPPLQPAGGVSGSPVSLNLNPPNQNDCGNLTVGMIDTPIQTLGGNLDQFLLPTISVTGNNVVPSSSEITHGTGIAQTILAAVAQAAKQNVVSGGPAENSNPVTPSSSVRILPVDVYGNSETTTSWNVALGVQAAVNKGATVLNLSLGSYGDSEILDSVIQQAMADGIIVFAAAGNDPVSTPTYPAAIPGVNAVTALSQPGELASYANYGSFVNMALPGGSQVYLDGTSYTMQGTSVATAYASGIAAESRSGDCGLSWAQVQSAMVNKFPVPAGE